jgi:hypothetical protein
MSHSTVTATERGALAVILALLTTAGLVGTTTATLSAKTTNATGTYATSALYAPASVSGAASGHNVALTWPAGTNGNGYSVLGAANGTSSNCSAASFASIGTSASASYTDTGRYTPEGNYFCYQVQTTYGSWSSVNSNPFTAVQIGFVPTTAGITAGGTAAKLDTGDVITINFNQSVATGAAGAVCGYKGSGAGSTPGTSDTIWLGSSTTSNTNCGAAESVSVGSLVGGTVGASTSRSNATYVWSNSNKTLTITLGAFIRGTGPATTAAAWTFHGSTSLLSQTGSNAICVTNTAPCQPATSSSNF